VWLETLMDLQQTVPDGMFLTSVNPLHRGGNTKSGGMPVEAIRGIRISGISYLDKEPAGEDAVKLFWEAICKEQRFSDKTRIVKRPTAKSFAREYVIDVIFEVPIKL
ncbi:MAG: hypothetical protein K9M45_06725, partial [Kiritimatiellales bacterium]|nr:hypothetical protein [Kiritimatiellales bacterium]